MLILFVKRMMVLEEVRHFFYRILEAMHGCMRLEQNIRMIAHFLDWVYIKKWLHSLNFP